jgi:hypothetical protein
MKYNHSRTDNANQTDEIKRRDMFHKCKQLYDITFLIDTHCSKEKEKQ